MRRIRLLLFCFVFLGFLVRIAGIDFGLPFIYHDDEPIIVNYALAYGTGDFNPHFFNVPPLLSYVLFAGYGLFYIAGLGLGLFSGVRDFAYLYLNDPTVFYLIGRIALGVLPGTFSVLLIYFLGKKLFSVKAGLISAFFLALNFLHVRDSHYIYFDIPLAFFLIAFFIKSLDLARTDSWRDHIWVGVLAGMTTAVKYFAPLLAPFLVLLILHNSVYFRISVLRRALKTFSIIAVAAAVFFSLHPYAFINFAEFIRQLSNIPVTPLGPLFHLKVSLAGSSGVFVIVFAFLGIILSAVRKNRGALLMAVFVFYYYFVLVFKSQAAARYVMPMIPVLIVFASYFLCSIAGTFKVSYREKTATALLALVLVFPSAQKTFLLDMLFMERDTRTLAYDWVKETLPASSMLAIDATGSGFPRLEKEKQQIKEIYGKSRETTFNAPRGAKGLKAELMLSNPDYPEITYNINYLRETKQGGFHSIFPDISIDIDELIAKNVRYVILSNLLDDPRYESFVRELRGEAVLLVRFSPYRESRDRKATSDVVASPAAAFSLKELEERKTFGPYFEIYAIKGERHADGS